MAGSIYEPTSGALSRTPILCKVEDPDPVVRFELSIKVWRGDVASVPATATYFLIKYPDESNGATFDISQLLQSEFESDYQTFSVFDDNTNQVIWVQCNYVIVGLSTNQNIAGVPFIVYDGYGEFIEGVNAVAPIVASSQTQELLLNESSAYTLALNQAGLPYSIETINVVFDIGGSTDIANIKLNLDISEYNLLYTDVSPSVFTGLYDKSYVLNVINTNTDTIAVINVEVECEPKFTPVTIAFINKNGAWDYLTFSKARKEMIDVESSEFMPYILGSTFGNAPSYSATTSQIKRYDINANESITLNTTFLPESYYETIKQLMMSNECVWVERGLSLNPKTMNMMKKISVNKEMIQYTVDFSHASLTQSTVR